MPDFTTAGELADYLATVPRAQPVIVARDAEGNEYSPLSGGVERMYEADGPRGGEVRLTPEQRAEQDNPDDWGVARDDAVRAIVLYPVR